MKKLFTILIFIFFSNNLLSQIDKIHPPNWWIGFENQNLQLLVRGELISDYKIHIDYPGIEVRQIHKADSPNYLFIDLIISNSTKAGIVKLKFKIAMLSQPLAVSVLNSYVPASVYVTPFQS